MQPTVPEGEPAFVMSLKGETYYVVKRFYPLICGEGYPAFDMKGNKVSSEVYQELCAAYEMSWLRALSPAYANLPKDVSK